MSFLKDQDLPSVTIAIPTLNEEAYIEYVLSTFCSSTYPNICEILVADGGSEDKTRDKVIEYSQKYSHVRLLHNPQKIQSSALNLMISEARGDIFLRADAHCLYAVDYVEMCVDTLLKKGVHNAGGAQRHVARDKIQAGIALAVRSFLGSGGARYKNPDFEGFADTVFLGCFYTKDLREIGGFRSGQRTNEDNELNLRLRIKFGNSIYVSSQIKSWYFPRSTFSSLIKQYKYYGEGRCLTHYVNKKKSEWRGRLPFWVIAIFSLFVLLDIIFISYGLISFGIISGLLILYFIESFRISFKTAGIFISEIWRGKPEMLPGLFNRAFNCFIALIGMQIAHFTGYGSQLIKLKFSTDSYLQMEYRLNEEEGF
jgi:succinoglycan biosynthesis protein ExoA